MSIPSNIQIADIFGKLSAVYEQKGDNYRALAYRNASLAIAKHSVPITSGKQAMKLRGVGKSTAQKIDEYLQTGKLKIFDTLEMDEKQIQQNKTEKEKEKEKTLELFQGIYGVGPSTAEKWYKKGYRTMDDLKDVKKNKSQQLGYYYYYHLIQRIPRKEMDRIANRIKQCLNSISPNIEHQICGSYRRGEKTSGDIDCLIKGEENIELQQIINSLTYSGLIVGNLALGKTKYLGICRLDEKHNARRIDLMMVKPDSWPYATLYFTGSQKLNIQMRNRAIELGYTLNEYGLYDSEGNNVPASSEEEIFKHLGMKYLNPHERSIK